MRVPKRTINIELLLGISATFLSLAALVVSIFQTKIAREQQHKSVLPYLQIRHEISDNQLVIYLENQGVGPAFIKSFATSYHQKDNDSYNEFIIGVMDDFRVALNAIPENQLTNSKYDSLLRTSKKFRISDDYVQGGKDADILYAGSAIKEGDNRLLFTFKRSGSNGGPFVSWMGDLVADSSYHIRVTYSDVYDNCWQLTHTLNRNSVLQLANCPPPSKP
ncbi:hypothetical protein [Spirosoma agri]|uniref:Uncharacterized protein n=1 Tax=Spirosoma agri TaxID=1987381 RepID=A0A6M0IG94_9BACT|nr:hypothetical protein [Spirosoma agri]NEU66877.1 hypothetical protein [Spirosoma agri]